MKWGGQHNGGIEKEFDLGHILELTGVLIDGRSGIREGESSRTLP